MNLQKKKNKTEKWWRLFWKIVFLFCFFFTLYYSLVWIVLFYSSDPIFQSFEKYHRLYNWDLKEIGREDFDGDGKKDLVLFSGCAFLSAADQNKIPTDQQCFASGTQDYQTGQKYINSLQNDLSLNAYRDLGIRHSYLAKNSNENWKIFINSGGELAKFEIGKDGFLKKENGVSLVDRINEVFYFLSYLFIPLALPSMPFTFALHGLFKSITQSFFWTSFYTSLTLSLITLISYLAYKSTSK